jgi:hypothetical protein
MGMGCQNVEGSVCMGRKRRKKDATVFEFGQRKANANANAYLIAVFGQACGEVPKKERPSEGQR